MPEDDQRTPSRTGIIGWFTRHPWTTGLLCTLLVLILVTFLFDRNANQQLGREIAAIKAKGEPTTIEDINREMAEASPDQNPAHIILDRAVFLHGPLNFPDECYKDLPLIGSARLGLTGVPLPLKHSETLRQFFLTRMGDLWIKDKSERGSNEAYPDDATVSDALRELYDIISMPGGHYKKRLSTPAIFTTLPELATYRNIGRLIACAAEHHAESGDMSDCAVDLEALFGFSRMLESKYPTLIQMLVQMAMESLYIERIERAINRRGLTSVELQANQIRLTDVQNGPNIRSAMMVERVCFIDTYCWVESGVGNISTIAGLTAAGPSLPMTPNIWQYIPVLPSLDAAYGLEWLNLCVEAAESPGPVALSKVRKAELRISNAPAYLVYSSSMLPSLSRSMELQLKSIGSKRAMIAALACERHRLATGEWPESLTDLVPEYLKAVPVDPFDDAPIRYAVTSEGIKLWCIGEDLKDDGGDIKRREKQTASNKPTDWGWVILNPNLRGKPLPEPTKPNAASAPATQSAGN